MYHYATVLTLLSRSWRVRKKAQQTVRKLLSSLGGASFARGLLGELRVVVNKHKVKIKKPQICHVYSSVCNTINCCPMKNIEFCKYAAFYIYIIPQSSPFFQSDFVPSTLKGFASGGSAVRIGGVDRSGPQLCPPSCAAGGSVCYLLHRQPLGRPR